MREPAITLLGGDRERHVAHAQTWVSAFLRVRRRPAPVLLEEHLESALGRLELLLGVERAQFLVRGHAVVEDFDETVERRVASEPLVQGCLTHVPSLSPAADYLTGGRFGLTPT